MAKLERVVRRRGGAIFVFNIRQVQLYIPILPLLLPGALESAFFAAFAPYRFLSEVLVFLRMPTRQKKTSRKSTLRMFRCFPKQVYVRAPLQTRAFLGLGYTHPPLVRSIIVSYCPILLEHPQRNPSLRASTLYVLRRRYLMRTSRNQKNKAYLFGESSDMRYDNVKFSL